MKRASFLDFFPPPEFMAMPSFGLSLSDEAVRIVSFVTKKGKTSLKVAEEYSLSPGIITSGSIARPDQLLIVLKNIRNEHKVKFARVALPEEKAFVYETTIPTGGDIHDAVEFTLEQNIPLSPAEAVFDYSILEESKDQVKVIVTAYSREAAETIADLLQNAGIIPITFELESQAIARAVTSPGRNETNLIIHFLKEKAILSITTNGIVRFSSVFSQNVDGMAEALSRHEGEAIMESVELLEVRDEIKKVYSYWQSEHTNKSKERKERIESIIVSGNVSHMLDVADYISKYIGLPARLANVWRNAFSFEDCIPDLPFENSLHFASAAGLALN